MGALEAVQATKISVISLSIILGFLLLTFPITHHPLILFMFAGAIISFMICLALLFMALRKFGNEEIESGSKIVKKANLFGFLAFALVILGISVKLYDVNPFYTALFLFISFLLFVWVFMFGKREFKYW